MTDADTLRIIVVRRFAASPARVFDAWLDPDSARRWLFATPGGKVVRAEIDPRTGGTYVIADRRDGGDVVHTGEYLEIDRPRRLVFTFAVPKFSPDSARVSIDITPVDGGCELTLTQEMKASLAEYRDRTEQGWRAMLDSLAKVVE